MFGCTRKFGIVSLALAATVCAGLTPGPGWADEPGAPSADARASSKPQEDSAGSSSPLATASPAEGADTSAQAANPGTPATQTPPSTTTTPTAVTPPAVVLQGNFFERFFQAYQYDWRGTPANFGPPAPNKRGYPTPVTNPPYPFADWPYGGSPDLSAPWTQSAPLMQAIWSGKHGDWWLKSGIQIYGWINFGANVSTSNNKSLGKYTNYPEAYAEVLKLRQKKPN